MILNNNKNNNNQGVFLELLVTAKKVLVVYFPFFSIFNLNPPNVARWHR